MEAESEPNSVRGRLVAAASCGVAFAVIWVVVARMTWPGRLDVRVTAWAAQHRTDVLTAFFEAITHLGSMSFLIPAAALLGGFLLIRRREWKPLVWFALTLAVTGLSYSLVKTLVARPRPPEALRITDATGWAFPSGHAAQAVAFWSLVAVLLSTGRSRRTRAASVGAAVTLAIAIGISRIYLGAHWTTDVLAGWVLGGFWLFLVLALVLAMRERPGSQATQAGSAD
jgi:undecaprenyl-diphosphatase